ncbi:hypothetical protein RCL_jg7552.t1 [Rhizophagus clarus]|uniref:Uncharacterized protein n=1 Tax=Rhizophagus clarus TaxID=94130 RepID=A0A8H3L149_9GLOM|nr:hypothetical protein RCL_jg7552.t1 [Rhizophagus clarus]
MERSQKDGQDMQMGSREKKSAYKSFHRVTKKRKISLSYNNTVAFGTWEKVSFEILLTTILHLFYDCTVKIIIIWKKLPPRAPRAAKVPTSAAAATAAANKDIPPVNGAATTAAVNPIPATMQLPVAHDDAVFFISLTLLICLVISALYSRIPSAFSPKEFLILSSCSFNNVASDLYNLIFLNNGLNDFNRSSLL